MTRLRDAIRVVALHASLLLHGQTTPSDPAISALVARLSSEPRNAQLREQIGVAYTRRQDFDTAARYYRMALQIDSTRVSAAKNLATVLWFSGKKDEAAGIFKTLEKRIPNDPVPALYLGLEAFEHQDFARADVLLARAGPLAADNPEVVPVLIETYLAVGKFAQAKSLIEIRIASGEASSIEESAQNYRWLGRACDGLKLPDEAYQAYERAIQRAPDIEENYLELSMFAMEHANEAFAREALDRGLQHRPDSAKLSMQMGLAWAAGGDYAKSTGYFKKASIADPGWSLPLMALGIAEIQAGHFDAAKNALARARSNAPRDYRAHYLYALALARSDAYAGQRAGILGELRRAIELNPRHAPSRILLAETQSSTNPSAAEGQLREALRLQPDDPTALYQLALLCRRQGKIAEAERLSQAFQAAKSKARENENELVLIMKTLK